MRSYELVKAEMIMSSRLKK